uniref:Uncharacterized protein n=1 Tax=Arundo donax TaxID=35708 RepID=A0A0A9DLR1_ARUDO
MRYSTTTLHAINNGHQTARYITTFGGRFLLLFQAIIYITRVKEQRNVTTRDEQGGDSSESMCHRTQTLEAVERSRGCLN